jgi:NAD(P)-dependent dehydrogenase (short-subunit alcohol dehydrogenase family)
VLGLTRTAALEYAAKGIRVNAIWDEKAFEALSKSSPIGRIGKPEEIASAVLWLCGPGASYVVGHPLIVDGGLAAQ